LNDRDGKIAIFMPNLGGGGAERVAAHQANGLAARGYRVDLLLAQNEGPYLRDLSADVHLIDLGAARVSRAVWPLSRYLRRERPRILTSQLHHANLAMLAARRLARVPTRTVPIIQHTTSVHFALQGPSLKSAVMLRAMRRVYPWADTIVVVSREAAEDFIEVTGVPESLVRVIYSPVIFPELADRAKAPVDHPWFAPNEPPVILAIGRLEPQKDFPTLLNSFALLRKQQNARLMILGEGGQRSRLESLIGDLGLAGDVALPGFVENPFAYLSRCSLFVLSSIWEALPTVLIEALALGAPIVSTKCKSGPTEILDRGKYGALVPVGDVEELSRAMRDALAARSSPVPDHHLHQFTVSAALEEYVKLFAELTADR